MGRNDELSLEKVLDTAYKQYKTGHQQCDFTFPGGERCIIRPASVHHYHQSANGRRTYGDFVTKHMYSSDWIMGIRRLFIDFYRALVMEDGLLKQPTGKPLRYMEKAHRERYLRAHAEKWSHIRSNKTCLACLQQVPENVLQCGHAYCVLCVKELGTESQEFESAWLMNHCSLCWASQNNPHLVRVKPK